MEINNYCTKPYNLETCINEQCVFKNYCYYYIVGKKRVTYSSNTTGYETIEKEFVTNGVKYIAVEEAEQMPVPVKTLNKKNGKKRKDYKHY